jgi:hypothetical protein
VPPETQFAIFFNDNRDLDPNDQRRPIDHDAMIDRLKTFSRFGDLQLPFAEFTAEFRRGSATFQNAFHAMLAMYTKKSRKQICIAKSPQHLDFAETLNRWYPDARFIHMIRDGRDVALSLRKVQFARYPLRHGCLIWKRALARGRNLEHKRGHRWLNVRMEDLIANPPAVVGRVMDFLELPFEPAQLSATSHRQVFPEREREFKAESQQPINPQKISCFRTEGTPDEIRLMDLILARDLSALGFPDSEIRTSSRIDDFLLRVYAAAFSVVNTRPVIRLRALLGIGESKTLSRYIHRGL